MGKNLRIIGRFQYTTLGKEKNSTRKKNRLLPHDLRKPHRILNIYQEFDTKSTISLQHLHSTRATQIPRRLAALQQRFKPQSHFISSILFSSV